MISLETFYKKTRGRDSKKATAYSDLKIKPSFAFAIT